MSAVLYKYVSTAERYGFLMKKDSILRKVSFLLVILMLAGSVLTACSEAGIQENSPAAEETSSEVEVLSETETETEEVLTDNVPALDFGGETVTIAGQQSDGAKDFGSEELTGEVVNDAIFYREAEMEERFNVVFGEPLATDYGTVSSTIKAMVQAGDATYDFVLNQLAQTSADALNGNYMNLNEIPYLDFSQRWYPASVLESASLNDKLYLMVSDICISYVGQTWSMCFNKDLAEDMGVENLYDLVREGEWTLDKLMEITSDIYIDVNGDGVRNESDCYGFTMGKAGIDGCKGAALIYGAGLSYMKINDDFSIKNLLGSEQAQLVAEKFYELNTQVGSTYYTGHNYPLYAMMEEVAVFVPAQLHHYYNHARDFEGSFGVLPLPKADTAQENYATLADAGCNCISVPVTIKNPELTGAMIEAMSAYSTNNVVPAFVDVSLQTKVARDEESVEMMQVVLDSRVMDFAYLYCGWSGWTWQLADLFRDPGQYASTYTTKQKVMNKIYEKMIENFIEE